MISWQPGMTLESIEKQVILKAFSFYQGNKTKTAQSLGIAIRTLDNKLLSYEGKSNGLQGSAEKGEGDLQTSTGHPVEPPTQISPEHALPMQQQQEVQEVLPKQAASGHSGKKRRS